MLLFRTREALWRRSIEDRRVGDVDPERAPANMFSALRFCQKRRGEVAESRGDDWNGEESLPGTEAFVQSVSAWEGRTREERGGEGNKPLLGYTVASWASCAASRWEKSLREGGADCCRPSLWATSWACFWLCVEDAPAPQGSESATPSTACFDSRGSTGNGTRHTGSEAMTAAVDCSGLGLEQAGMHRARTNK